LDLKGGREHDLAGLGVEIRVDKVRAYHDRGDMDGIESNPTNGMQRLLIFILILF
jgi:hypothetical protein